MLKISVIGAGAWGRALALKAYQASSQVMLIGHRQESLDVLKVQPAIKVTTSRQEARDADIVLIAVPSQEVRGVLKALKPILSSSTNLLIASKGIEEKTGFLMSEVVDEVLGARPLGILSGPNFAHEVAENLPTATMLGFRGSLVTDKILKAFEQKNFQIHLSEDLIGVQIAGAVKNVLAIGCGIVRAQGAGDNAVAALIALGLQEIAQFGIAKGAHLETFLGLAGVGDIILTCGGTQSRNFKFGFQIGNKGNSLSSLPTLDTTVEGVFTAKALYELAKRLKIKMPIAEKVYKILYEQAPFPKVIEEFL